MEYVVKSNLKMSKKVYKAGDMVALEAKDAELLLKQGVVALPVKAESKAQPKAEAKEEAPAKGKAKA